MNSLLIVLIGVAVVVGGILWLRLHAFLALIAASVVVALLTPSKTVYRFSLRAGQLEWKATADQNVVDLTTKTTLPIGSQLIALIPAESPTGFRNIATLNIVAAQSAKIVSGESPLQASEIIVDPATQASALSEMKLSIGPRIAEGFGKTAADIGILIAMAAVLGNCLMESGAAERIVISVRNGIGQQRAALAFVISGFVLAALVLSDTTFYLLIPIAQVMRARSGKDYTLYIMSIAAGAVMSHSLVPPAAGPLFVADQLHVNLAAMMLGGAIVGGIASLSGYIFAHWANRKWDIPLRGAVGVSQAELEKLAGRDESTLPPLFLSLLPIVIPVILIAASAVVDQMSGAPLHPLIRSFLKTAGDKNIALIIGAAIGLLMVWAHPVEKPAQADGKRSSAPIGRALASAGVMILIISAGGAFGFVVRQLDVAVTIKDLLPASRLALLPLAFLVTAAVRTAQGSAIVSMITAIGIVGPIAAAGGLGYNPLYLALAIGCGSKPFPWMNDAGFWIIGRMSGMTEGETLKTVSVMMVIMGVVGLLATMAGAWLFPLA